MPAKLPTARIHILYSVIYYPLVLGIFCCPFALDGLCSGQIYAPDATDGRFLYIGPRKPDVPTLGTSCEAFTLHILMLRVVPAIEHCH